MSARDEILDALRKRPAGLTTAELAPLCPAADHDKFIVARVIAQLRQEQHVVGAPTGPREGHTVFILARAGTPPAAAPAQHQAPPTTGTKEPAMSITAQILAALEKHGPMNTEALAKHVKSDNLSIMASTLARDGKLIVDKSLGRGHYVYHLPGAAPARSTPTPPPAPADRTQRPATPPSGAPKAGNGAADFAITAGGQLSIRKGEHVVSLEPGEYAQLRQFTDRAEAIWKETV